MLLKSPDARAPCLPLCQSSKLRLQSLYPLCQRALRHPMVPRGHTVRSNTRLARQLTVRADRRAHTALFAAVAAAAGLGDAFADPFFHQVFTCGDWYGDCLFRSWISPGTPIVVEESPRTCSIPLPMSRFVIWVMIGDVFMSLRWGSTPSRLGR